MGQSYDALTPELRTWFAQQKVFFVATAPLQADGHVNCSPKGGDTFRVVNDRMVAYLDVTGSGIETIAHLRENGRIVLMFCAFEGPPKVLRLHGKAEVLYPGNPDFDRLLPSFPTYPGIRSIIRVTLDRIADSCGYNVPRLDFVERRDALARWSAGKGEPALADYRCKNNLNSIDGLPGYLPAAATNADPAG